MFPGQLPSEQPLASRPLIGVLCHRTRRQGHLTPRQHARRRRSVSAAQRRSSVSAACLDAEASRAEARTTSSFVSDCTIGSIKRAAQGRKASHRSTRKSLRKLRKQQKMIQNGLSNRQDPIHLRAAPRSGAALTCQHPTLTCQRPIPMIYSREVGLNSVPIQDMKAV